LVLSLALRDFLRFSSLRKNQHFKTPIGASGRRATIWNHCANSYLFYLSVLISIDVFHRVDEDLPQCRPFSECHDVHPAGNHDDIISMLKLA
jgi:hypothetical protein